MLFGGAGNDTLSGMEGDDVLNGATGADIFVFGTGNFGNDTISNFATAAFNTQHDVIRFAAGAEVTTFAQFVDNAAQLGDDVIYDRGNDGINVITIENTALANLSADDFIFG